MALAIVKGLSDSLKYHRLTEIQGNYFQADSKKLKAKLTDNSPSQFYRIRNISINAGKEAEVNLENEPAGSLTTAWQRGKPNPLPSSPAVQPAASAVSGMW